MNWSDILFACHEVERSVSLVEEGLCFEGFQGDDLETSCAGHAEFGFEEMDGGGFGGDVEFFVRFEFVLAAVEHLACETFLFLAFGHGVIWLVHFDRG